MSKVTWLVSVLSLWLATVRLVRVTCLLGAAPRRDAPPSSAVVPHRHAACRRPPAGAASPRGRPRQSHAARRTPLAQVTPRHISPLSLLSLTLITTLQFSYTFITPTMLKSVFFQYTAPAVVAKPTVYSVN